MLNSVSNISALLDRFARSFLGLESAAPQASLYEVTTNESQEIFDVVGTLSEAKFANQVWAWLDPFDDCVNPSALTANPAVVLRPMDIAMCVSMIRALLKERAVDHIVITHMLRLPRPERLHFRHDQAIAELSHLAQTRNASLWLVNDARSIYPLADEALLRHCRQRLIF